MGYRLAPRAAEPALSARARAELFGACDLDDLDLEHWRHDQLSDPIARLDEVGFFAEVDQQHLDLAAIVLIDRARRIEHGHAVLEREPRARPDLPFAARRKLDRKPRRDESARAGL